LECLEHESSIDIYEAARNSWSDLCTINESTQQDVDSFVFRLEPGIVRGLPDTAVVVCGTGYQIVKIGKAVDTFGNPRQQEERSVRVELCLIRLPSIQTDILLTLSTPCSQNPLENEDEQIHGNTFQIILSTLSVVDWTLFD
jgi:hypothetical protein